MQIARLVEMTNDVSNYFAAEPDPQEAATNTATHLRRFWDDRMREEIIAHYNAGAAGLTEVARSAVEVLAKR